MPSPSAASSPSGFPCHSSSALPTNSSAGSWTGSSFPSAPAPGPILSEPTHATSSARAPAPLLDPLPSNTDPFDAALALNPDDDQALYQRACFFLVQQDFDRAIADFDRCITLRPTHDALQYRNAAYYGKGQRDALRQRAQLERECEERNERRRRELRGQLLWTAALALGGVLAYRWWRGRERPAAGAENEDDDDEESPT